MMGEGRACGYQAIARCRVGLFLLTSDKPLHRLRVPGCFGARVTGTTAPRRVLLWIASVPSGDRVGFACCFESEATPAQDASGDMQKFLSRTKGLEMKRLLVAVLFGIASLICFDASAQQIRMVQCESCATNANFKSVAIAKGPGTWSVFSITNRLIVTFGVEYEPELGRNIAWNTTTPSQIETGFALMLEANSKVPGMLTANGQRTLIVDINKLGGGPHDPVSISLGGEQSAQYGAFIREIDYCFPNDSCTDRLSPALTDLLNANESLTQLAINIFSAGSISWQTVPDGFKLWLCEFENGDCALVEYDSNTKKWKYVESRSNFGKGARYPKYGETTEYSFTTPSDALYFEAGLKDAGASIFGSWTIKSVLACVSTGGVTSCRWFVVASQ
jgi:hypothetical protein